MLRDQALEAVFKGLSPLAKGLTDNPKQPLLFWLRQEGFSPGFKLDKTRINLGPGKKRISADAEQYLRFRVILDKTTVNIGAVSTLTRCIAAFTGIILLALGIKNPSFLLLIDAEGVKI